MIKFLVRPIILMAFISSLSVPTQAKDVCCKTENVILITLDGVRWREVFQGVDKRFFDQPDFLAYKKTHAEFKQEFWRESPDDRREILFPFLWNVVAKRGQIYGNRTLGSKADITNKLHFSYPGYNEILTGFADPRINSNDKIQNPNQTFLEWLDKKPAFKGKAAAFGSWDVFPYIINEKRSGVFTNAGFEVMDILLDTPRIQELNQLQKDIPSPWDTVRLDAFTYNFAFEYLKAKKPRALYISLGETDDFAHEGQYDQYILAARRNDAFIARIWNWVQTDPQYRNKTTLLITTDHGRGHLNLEQWKHHGRFPYTAPDGTEKIADIKEDDAIWMAVIGPDTPATGEMKNIPDVKQNQIAATLMKFLGLSYKGSHKTIKAGAPIKMMFR
ncbi:hypothetical protein [Paremcibacter congregatus]|uniref:hypothetical protein n=1 Tax=Paremcibacter congregatus TaxID=2043170 RepID=UPI0030EF30E9|tara:strand:+ start:5419 stop:6582 length:1164 start_codon:yes stop_codon:yes gene_type:complete